MLCFSGSDLSVNPSNPSQDVPAAVGAAGFLEKQTSSEVLKEAILTVAKGHPRT